MEDECPKVYTPVEFQTVTEERARMREKLKGWKWCPIGFLTIAVCVNGPLALILASPAVKASAGYFLIPGIGMTMFLIIFCGLLIRGITYRKEAKNIIDGDLMIYKEFNAYCVIENFEDYSFGIPRFCIKLNETTERNLSLNKLRPATDEERLMYITHGPQID